MIPVNDARARQDGRGKIERVNGPGVIGKYPAMFPGAHFHYASCCPLSTPTGSMKGSFNMVLPDGSSFDAEVAQFEFVAPAQITL